MTQSYAYTETTAFTVTNARHMAAKVATDLKRMQRFYGDPSDASIASYEMELIALIKGGYLGTVAYGYRRNNGWIVPTLSYTAQEFAGAANDDDPGRVPPGADITGASFYSYLTYSAAWDRLSGSEQETFKRSLPFLRGSAPEPGASGYFAADRSYSSGGRALCRASVRSW